VVLYDSLDNSVVQVLTTYECSKVIWAHFMGKTGRYLAAVGQHDVVIWDLILQCGRLSDFHG
jgi:NET1-associated nuclear protein 1 (U3 small nucleolar RNA-associated protein 17)